MTEKTFESSNGWIITYKTDLTYGQSIELQKYLTAGSSVVAGQAPAVSSERGIDTVFMAMDLLISKIDKKDNVVVSVAPYRESINELSASDGKKFQDEILKIITSAMGGDDTQKKMKE